MRSSRQAKKQPSSTSEESFPKAEEYPAMEELVKGPTMKDLCDQIQDIVDRTEILWLEVERGKIRYAPEPLVPASGNGPIKNLIKHLKSLDKQWLKKEPSRYILRISVKPFEAEIVIWIPNLG